MKKTGLMKVLGRHYYVVRQLFVKEQTLTYLDFTGKR